MSLEYEMGIEFVWLSKRLAGIELWYWNWMIADVENVKRYVFSLEYESKKENIGHILLSIFGKM